MVLDSHNNNEGDRFGFKPFKFGDPADTSEFYIRFIVNGIEHEYSFTCTRDEIVTESLYHYPKGRKAMIFSRDERKVGSKKEKYESASVIRRPMDVTSNTSRKTLSLSRASQMDREKCKEIYRWFTSIWYSATVALRQRSPIGSCPRSVHLLRYSGYVPLCNRRCCVFLMRRRPRQGLSRDRQPRRDRHSLSHGSAQELPPPVCRP